MTLLDTLPVMLLLARSWVESCVRTCGVSDIACRYGGDEFVLILPDSSLDDTRRRVQQILELVKELRIWHDGHLLESLTVSAGVAAAHEHNFNGREILRAADEALYAAKQAGRDLV
jgi:diguanylate cyclase (GGDEF)-like protein